MSTTAAKETAGATTRLIVRYVRAQAGAGAVRDMLELAGDDRPLSVLEDERSWSTYDQKVALFDAASKVLGDAEAAWRIGESVLREQIAVPVRMVLWALGSPGQLLQNVARAGTKFSTVADLTCRSVEGTSAVVTYRLQEAYQPSVHDCGYTAGLLSQSSALFGLPAARVRHDECQVRGAPECVYHVSWPARRRLFAARRRARRLEVELRLMTDQIESLQRAAAEIVAAVGVEDTISHIAARTRSIVRAAGYMIAVQPLAGGPPVIHLDGLSDEEAIGLHSLALGEDVAESPNRLVVELRSARRAYGRIIVTNPGDDPFFPEERRMLVAFAGLAATALDAAVARETLAVLSELGQSLADLTGSDEVCQRVADALPLLVGSPIAAVARWTPEEESLRFVGIHGFTPDMEGALRNLVVRPSDSPALQVQLAAPEPRLWTTRSGDPFITSMLKSFSVDAAMTVPVVVRGALLGYVIACWQTTPPEAFRSELIARLAEVASQAATALENARLLEATTHLALHDPLTGLPNRVLLDDRLEQAAARARRDGSQIGVLLVDLDGFKMVNDTFGHRAGDEVLREVGRRLLTVLRQDDTAARFGGDEFILICQGVSGAKEVETIAARVDEVLAPPIDIGGELLVVSASVGVAAVDGDVADIDALVAWADAAMYDVKRERPERAPRHVRS